VKKEKKTVVIKDLTQKDIPEEAAKKVIGGAKPVVKFKPGANLTDAVQK